MAKRSKIEKELVFDVILYVLGVTAVVLLYKNNALLASLMLIGWLIAVKMWHKKEDVYLFVVAAAAGTLAEAVAIKFGAWQYANPTALGVPIWLPFLWGAAVVFIKRFSETVLRFRNEK